MRYQIGPKINSAKSGSIPYATKIRLCILWSEIEKKVKIYCKYCEYRL